MRLLALVVLLAMPFSAAAQVRPQPGMGNPHVQSVDYDPDQVVMLQSAPGYQISVELAPDEHIENVAVGDSGAWQVSANRRGNRLFVKPTQQGVTTNMVVVTDARLYSFELVPLSGPQPDMAYTVRFRYPTPARATPGVVAGAQAKVVRYRLRGSRALRPTGIDDDGVHTYIEWPADRALPAIYAVDGAGHESLVNGMMREGLLVIDSVQPRLVFRVDKRSASAERVADEAP